MTLSEEDYIKVIYHLEKGETKMVSTNAIAEQMQTKPSSVTDMVKKLSEKNLVNHRRYKGVSLTKTGKKTAISIVRKHRLWEVFLVEKLNFAWDEVHELAEQLEHIKSAELIERLDAHLGYPSVDPHGDPIPSKEGKFEKVIRRLLSELKMGEEGICVAVKDSSAPFLKFLDKNRIAIRDTIKTLEKEEFDNSLYIEVNGRKVHISNQIASNLYVEIKETNA